MPLRLASRPRLQALVALVVAALAVVLAVLFLRGGDAPGDIVQRAAAAARDGDRDRYLACFTERSRPILETLWAAAAEKNPPLAALGAAEVQVVAGSRLASRDVGLPDRVLLVVSEGVDQMRVVLHGEGGSWRIDLLDTERYEAGVPAY
ncbi:MAG: hypothetical protein KC635_09975 [Myxococcales bacterium]|nr:hypothetical protein [Myxococcales bacterium]MCB9731277.1 hypothetical protein [Deltaproteobacteria bacterium]